ncbi:MAG: deoxyribose-phosphate aldolase [Chloroflexi bacterium]|nr:deoxyribose-phosphate aldolase [Chloroflexota bacterium]
MYGITNDEIAKLVSAVDYSEVLTITAGAAEARAACADAKRFGFRAVVAFPQYLGVLVDELRGSGVRAQIPVGFPCGGQTTLVKCAEAEEGLQRGATDLDMVMNLSAFKAGDYQRVAEDIAAVRKVARPYGVPFKVIIEIGILTDAEIVTVAKLVKDSGADFVKTCTGFGPGRATVRAIGLIREAVGEGMGIKASGGVASLEDGIAFMRAGATVVALRHMLVEQLDAIGWKR